MHKIEIVKLQFFLAQLRCCASYKVVAELRSLICVGPGRKPRRPVAPSMLHSKNNKANTENPDETSRYEQSHLDLHCLQIRYTGKYNVQCSDKRKLAFVTASNKRANTVNPDETSLYEQTHLVLHCLQTR